MPEVIRQPMRMDCNGIDLVHPPDRQPPGMFPWLSNVRIVEEGRLEGRPGYDNFLTLSGSDTPNSIRRLNDPNHAFAALGYTFIGGGGNNLYAGTPHFGPFSDYNVIDTGYSGDPLTLLTFRPDQSPESWMYVYDSNKLAKVRADGQVRSQGIPPPSDAPEAEYGPPAMVTIADGDIGTWVPAGTAITATPGQDRTNSSLPQIGSILYDSGMTGWALINPLAVASFFWAGERMRVTLNPGGGTQETVLVREIHEAITGTSVQDIQYDSGSTGDCSIVLVGSPSGLDRNSLIRIDAELIRVLAVVLSADGTSYSIRCSTAVNHAAGAPVTGLLGWYVYATAAHSAGEAIAVKYVAVSNPAGGTGTATWTVGLNASSAAGRPISQADDWFHISLFFQNPQAVTSVVLKIDTGDGSFTKNFWTWTIPGTALNQDGQDPGGNAFTDLSFPLSTGVLTGVASLGSFANIAAIQVGLITTGATGYGFGCWYFFGTYGPEIQPNSPVGITYESRFRDSSTGARSVPGPQTRYQLFPLREEVLIEPAVTNAVGVDQIDIYRLGGAVTEFLYVGSVANNFTTPMTYADTQPDSLVLQANQPPDLTALQPFPVLDLAWSGIVNVRGTSVLWVSGKQFNPNLISGTIITINGIAYQTFGQPRSTTFLEILTSGGDQNNVSYQIASPNLAAQPLPFAFLLEGPFLPVVFALGDPINGGTLYFSNAGDADSASDQNTLELTGPSEPLISGASWNGLAFVGTREDLIVVRYSFLSGVTPYQFQKVPAPSGIWSRWACCTTPFGVAYLGRDGVYLATDQGAATLKSADGFDALYPIFPHDGTAALPVNVGGFIFQPVDMSQPRFLRLAYTDDSLIFSFLDIGGASRSLRYQFSRKRWLPSTYGDQIWTQYLVEGTAPDLMQVLLLSRVNPAVYIEGGNDDARIPIISVALTSSSDGGDERGQKLYVDAMVMADGVGELTMNASYDNAQSYSPNVPIVVNGGITQSIQNISSLAKLDLHRNIGAGFSWTGGPAGPRIYAWEPSGYQQPYLSTLIVTQFINLNYPGWKAARRFYAGLISNHDVFFTIECDDGRTYGPYAIPSTNGRFRIFPSMLDAGVKGLAMAFQLDGEGQPFALFPEAFTVEMKGFADPSYLPLAVFKS